MINWKKSTHPPLQVNSWNNAYVNATIIHYDVYIGTYQLLVKIVFKL